MTLSPRLCLLTSVGGVNVILNKIVLYCLLLLGNEISLVALAKFDNNNYKCYPGAVFPTKRVF